MDDRSLDKEVLKKDRCTQAIIPKQTPKMILKKEKSPKMKKDELIKAKSDRSVWFAEMRYAVITQPNLLS